MAGTHRHHPICSEYNRGGVYGERSNRFIDETRNIGAFLQLSAFILGVNFDINTFAQFYLIANMINFVPVMYCMMKLIGSDISSLLLRVSPVIIAVIGMILFILFINHFYPGDRIKGFLPLAWVLFYNISFYFSCLLVMSKNTRLFIYSKLRINS